MRQSVTHTSLKQTEIVYEGQTIRNKSTNVQFGMEPQHTSE